MAIPSNPAIKAPLAPDAALEALRNAPLDDEPVTDEERAAVEAAREALKRGEVVSTDELRRLLGL